MEEHTSKQNVVRYISVPSLESMALVSTVVQLWMQPEIKWEIKQHVENFDASDGDISAERDESFHRIKENITKKLSRLFLPESLKRKAADIIHPIGLQMVKWMDFNKREGYSCYNSEKYIDYGSWTMHGTVDKAKTVDIYTGDLEFAYCTACTYCLECHVKKLWDKMPQEVQNNHFFNEDMYCSYKYHLVAYWTCSIKKELSKLLSLPDPIGIYNSNYSIYKNMFMLSLKLGNVTAAKYFWHKLANLEICSNVTEWAEKIVRYMKISGRYFYQETEDYTSVLCFLLSQMDEEQQINVFRQHSEVILNSLFHNWPWQKYLIPTIGVMWDFLQGDVYVHLVEQFVRRIEIGKTTVNLMLQLWYNTPMKFRKCFIAHIGKGVLWNLLKIDDLDAIKLILNYANIDEKKKIISSILGSAELTKLILEDKLSSLQMLIRETLSSESEISDFKKNVLSENGNELCHFWILHNNWCSLEKFIAWSLVSVEDMRKFKQEKINKIEIFTSLVCAGNYALVNRFMNWCFSSDEEINRFKKYVALGNYYACGHDMVEKLGLHKDWTLFLQFMNYCLSSDEEISQFKELFTDSVMGDLMFNIIAYKYNFEFATRFLMWRFSSSKREIDKFKGKLMLSSRGRAMFCRFLSRYEVRDCGCNNWELVKTLIMWFYPFGNEDVKQFKKLFKKVYSFGFQSRKLKAFFYLLDIFVDHPRDCNSCEKCDITNIMEREMPDESDDSMNSGTETLDSDYSSSEDEMYS